MRSHVRPLSRVAVLLALGAAACSDDGSPVSTRPDEPAGQPGKPITVQSVECHGDRQTLSLTCRTDLPQVGANGDIIVGGQHTYVNVATSNIAYNSGTGQFTFDLSLQNLIEQPMGTTDGVALDPNGIRVFFVQPPATVTGTGAVAVLPDGFATFTAAGQPYYQYNQMLANGATSSTKVWTLIMPPTVTTFDFKLFVSAPVEYPNGYITMNGALPDVNVGNLHPGSTLGMTAVSKDPLGVVVPGTTIVFASMNATCATVSGAGVITGVQAQTCEITANDGTRSGSVFVNVTGMERVWDGSVSTDWSVGGNWVGDLAPVPADSVLIPTPVPNFPALVANTSIGGVTVADLATLSLGSFNLTASANIATGPTAGSGILSTTGQLILAGTGGVFHGRLPTTLVTGTYALDGDAHAIAVNQVDSGLVQSDMFEYSVDAQ
jgi:hypothetical protein